MSNLENLKNSERIIALILQALIEQGLRVETCLRMTDIGLEDIDDNEVLFAGCWRWLLEERIVRCSNDDRIARGIPMLNPVITAYGFSLLGQKFVGAPEEKLGQAVKRVAEGSADYSGIGYFVGGILGGLSKSLGS